VKHAKSGQIVVNTAVGKVRQRRLRFDWVAKRRSDDVPTSGVPPDLALAIERTPYEVLGQKLDFLKLDRRRRFPRKPCPD
jgi:hypothetical protein